MCMQDYKIGARIYPVIRTAAADANGLAKIEANPNRVGLKLLGTQGSVTMALVLPSGLLAVIGAVSATGTITGLSELLLKHQGNITMGPFTLSSSIGAGGSIAWVEYLAETEVIQRMMEPL